MLFTVFLATIFGLLAGGVINWLADDLPYTYLVKPPHYPDGTPRPLLAWLGITAYLCGYEQAPLTGARISWRHPATEIATALLFGYVVLIFPLGWATLVLWMNIFMLTLITVIDLEHRIILVMVIILGCVLALLGNLLAGHEIASRISFGDYLWGGVAGFLLFLLLYLGGMLFNNVISNARGEEITEVALGYGDVLLAAMSGFILGWQALIFAVVIAVFAGGVGALLFLSARLVVKGHYELFTALPYGQYIVFGTLIMMLWRSSIASFFL
ncbi:MAG: prepilin peptidase [Anaerolineae bacterium]|nr:prepilin peptidase [Anaerolineae bacterium]